MPQARAVPTEGMVGNPEVTVLLLPLVAIVLRGPEGDLKDQANPLCRSAESGAFKPLLYPSGPRTGSRHLCSSGILYCGNIRLLDSVHIRSNQFG
jgi:hypothetical protein